MSLFVAASAVPTTNQLNLTCGRFIAKFLSYCLYYHCRSPYDNKSLKHNLFTWFDPVSHSQSVVGRLTASEIKLNNFLVYLSVDSCSISHVVYSFTTARALSHAWAHHSGTTESAEACMHSTQLIFYNIMEFTFLSWSFSLNIINETKRREQDWNQHLSSRTPSQCQDSSND